jgi:hypothetical protein
VFKSDVKNTCLSVDERVAQCIDHEFGYREQQRPAPFSWQRQRLDIQRQYQRTYGMAEDLDKAGGDISKALRTGIWIQFVCHVQGPIGSRQRIGPPDGPGAIAGIDFPAVQQSLEGYGELSQIASPMYRFFPPDASLLEFAFLDHGCNSDKSRWNRSAMPQLENYGLID